MAAITGYAMAACAEPSQYGWSMHAYLVPGTGGGEDVTEPEASVVSPDDGESPGSPGAFPADYATAKDTPIVIDVEDIAPGLALVTVTCKFSGSTETFEVYDGDTFVTPFALHSTLTVLSPTHWRFSLRRDIGWPSGNSVTMNVVGTDADGNVLL